MLEGLEGKVCHAYDILEFEAMHEEHNNWVWCYVKFCEASEVRIDLEC